MIYLTAVALTLLPTPLLEPRYFTTSVVVAVLNAPIANALKRTRYLTLLFIMMNIIVVYIYVFKSFTWSDGSIARFMY